MGKRLENRYLSCSATVWMVIRYDVLSDTVFMVIKNIVDAVLKWIVMI